MFDVWEHTALQTLACVFARLRLLQLITVFAFASVLSRLASSLGEISASTTFPTRITCTIIRLANWPAVFLCSQFESFVARALIAWSCDTRTTVCAHTIETTRAAVAKVNIDAVIWCRVTIATGSKAHLLK
jgi:hypothetical protein